MPPTPATRGNNRWLPDAELDPHPAASWLLELGFDLWVRACYRRTILLPPTFHIAPGTLIASNHQRDVDGPMLGTVLVRRRGLRFEWPLPFFATREDLFRRGILTRLTVQWPAPLSALLGRIPLDWFFPLGRAEPMRRIREFTLGEALQAVIDAGMGDAPCVQALNARGLRELGVPFTSTVRGARAQAPPTALEHWWGLRRLQANARTRITPAFRTTVATQLKHFAARLDHGRVVYFAPEGSISLNGHFARVRGGFFQLVQATVVSPWIQPMAIGYDTLGPGRSRVVVNVGRAFRADRTLDRRQFDAALRAAVLRLVPITASHLLARYLLQQTVPFTQATLATWSARSIDVLRRHDATLDPLLLHAATTHLIGQRLRWLERTRLIVRRGEAFECQFTRDAAPSWESPANSLRYLANNLIDLVPDIDRVLPC
ncbi:MAG TPA: hypothetical protein VF264_03110 [Rhodanobacteraceae bacterium]